MADQYISKIKIETAKLFLAIIYMAVLFTESECRPRGSFVVTNLQISPAEKAGKVLKNIEKREVEKNSDISPQPAPKIVDVDIRSDIKFRYAKTVVKTYIKNPSISHSQEVIFSMVLPNTAFISNFTIQIDGKDEVYVAKVAKKEEAQESYNKAVESGQSAGIVDADTRDANQITVRSNLEAASKMLFTLTYEELLERHVSKYEHIIHVNPGQIVKNFDVNVYINESLPVIDINVPELKTDPNEITSELHKNSIAIINQGIAGNPNGAHIHFKPTAEDQKRMAAKVPEDNEKNGRGMSGQFIIQYDVDRRNQGNEIQVLDGYFVHFFAPDQLEVLPKHVVFVLDVSGSMSGVYLEQTKDAMLAILDDLSDKDYFNILTFSDEVYHWTPRQEDQLFDPNLEYDSSDGYEAFQTNPNSTKLTYQGTDSMRKQALKDTLDLRTIGGTNINDGLEEALNVVKRVRVSESISSNVKPIIIFLTDGQASTGVTNRNLIRENVLEANKELNVPIYGLAFGAGADFGLLKDIGRESGAFARRIYEASDATIQLEDFYQEISSPLLNNVTFDYVGNSFQNKTNKNFNTFFKGGEYVIAGKIDNSIVEDDDVRIEISGNGYESEYKQVIRPCVVPYNYVVTQVRHTSEISKKDHLYPPHQPCIPTLPSPISEGMKSDAENFIERLWAFLTIENLLENNQEEDKNENLEENTTEPSNEEKALSLALKYNFVTKLTSLVVIKPEDEKYSSGTVIKPESVSLFQQKNAYGRPTSYASYGTPAASYGAPAAGYSAATSYGAPSVPYSVRRRPAYRPQPQKRPAGGWGAPPPPRFSAAYRPKSTPQRKPQTTPPQSPNRPISNIIQKIAGLFNFGPNTDNGTPASNYGAPSPGYGAPHSYSSPNGDKTTSNVPDYDHALISTDVEIDLAVAACSMNMFDKTYLRGEQITLVNPNNSSISDLSQLLFDNKLASLEVVGPCCWKIFEKPDFKGHSKIFSEGKYKSSTNLGSALAREASSVLITTC